MNDAPANTLSCALVILNWNGCHLLQEFMPLLVEHAEGATIYVADNASTDTSIAWLQENYPQVKLIKNKTNAGYAGGYNQALATIEEDVYGLINSDVAVTEDFLRPILNAFESEPNTAIVQPKILDYNNKNAFEYAGAAGGFIDAYGFPFCRGRVFSAIEQDYGQYNDSLQIFWASGACFFVRKEVFRNLGGFDTDFFAHQEEIDFCWRAFNQGLVTKVCPQSVVYHVGGATLQTSSPQKTYFNFRNSLYLLTKNLPKQVYISVLVTRLLFDGFAGIYFLLQGQIKHMFAIIRAHGHFYKNYSAMKRKRGLSQKSDYAAAKSVVIDFYFKKKRTFSRIIYQ